jgi:hypothetical protein
MTAAIARMYADARNPAALRAILAPPSHPPALIEAIEQLSPPAIGAVIGAILGLSITAAVLVATWGRI